ncbi:MAG TPA: polymer-forming cytoskeletal protein [Actinomycetota bacterium]|nr:polymer-forming cytoskeletal protein [Actinomycetota bacterium]
MSAVRRLALLTSTMVAILLVPALALAQTSAHEGGQDQIVISGTVSVPRGRVVGEVIVLRGHVTIGGVATGDVVVLQGDVVVTGQVSGNVMAIDGSVTLGPSAQVGGDVIAREDVRVRSGARVAGRIRRHVAFMWRAPASVFGRFASWLAVTVSTLVLGLALVLVAPRGLDAASAAARSAPWASLGWGTALAVALPALSLLGIASVVAFPLGLEVALGLALLGSIGYAISGFLIGRLLWREPRGRLLAFALGWAILRAVGAIPYVSGVTWALGAVAGLGAASVAIWRARAVGGRHREGRVVPLPEPMREEAGL